MQCYIVRVYREIQEKTPSFAGVVETVGSGRKKAFRSFDEFCEIFDPGAKRRKSASLPAKHTIDLRTRRCKRQSRSGKGKGKGIPA